MSPDVVSVV